MKIDLGVKDIISLLASNEHVITDSMIERDNTDITEMKRRYTIEIKERVDIRNKIADQLERNISLYYDYFASNKYERKK